MDNATKIKLGVGAVLFATWAAIRFMHVQGADDLIAFIQPALAGLGAHVLTTVNSQVTK